MVFKMHLRSQVVQYSFVFISANLRVLFSIFIGGKKSRKWCLTFRIFHLKLQALTQNICNILFIDVAFCILSIFFNLI